MTTIFTDYENGTVGPVQTLRALCMSLGEVESELEPLAAEREQLRHQIGDVVARMDRQLEVVPGFGTIRITGPGISERYDTTAVDAIVSQLMDEGHGQLAEALAACKVKSMRAGGLRIERGREG